MSRKDTKGFKGGFIPTELKSPEARGRIASRENWHGSSDREESLSDPRWLKKPPKERKGTRRHKSHHNKHIINKHQRPYGTPGRYFRLRKSLLSKNQTSRRSLSWTQMHPETERIGSVQDAKCKQ